MGSGMNAGGKGEALDLNMHPGGRAQSRWRGPNVPKGNLMDGPNDGRPMVDKAHSRKLGLG